MAINLICNEGVKEIQTSDLSRFYKTPSEKTRSRSDSMTLAQCRLIKYLGLTEEESEKVCEKYGYYAGANYYLFRQLGITHEEAYERGIIDHPRPVDKCDAKHKAILDEYRRILDEKGIKAANRYFAEANANVLTYKKEEL